MEYRVLPPPEPVEPFDRSEWSSEELDPRSPTRRQWLLGLACGAAGLAAGVTVDRTLLAQGVPMPTGGASWLDWMLALRDEDLVRFAGVFETVSLEEIGNDAARASSAIAPAFTRLFEAALRVQGPWSDRAGSCAVRVLARASQRDALLGCEKLLAGRDLPLTRAAMQEALR